MTPERLDGIVALLLGDNMMVGTGRLFLLMGLIAAIGGGSFWWLAR